eukprot:1218807-Prymnesium_polylepis.1
MTQNIPVSIARRHTATAHEPDCNVQCHPLHSRPHPPIPSRHGPARARCALQALTAHHRPP